MEIYLVSFFLPFPPLVCNKMEGPFILAPSISSFYIFHKQINLNNNPPWQWSKEDDDVA